MATKRKLLLPSLTGIYPGSLAGTVGTFDIPLGYRYHQLELVYVDGSGAPLDIRALLGDVVLYRNGISERTHTSAELDHLNTLNGTQYGVQVIGAGATESQTQTIFLAEPWRKDKSDTDYMAWSADAPNGFRTFQLKLTLLANMPATASLYLRARVDAPIAPPKGGAQSVKKVYRQQLPANGVSVDVTTLDQRDAYQTICLKHPTGSYIQYATLKANGVLVLEKQNVYENVADLVQLGLNPANSITPGAFGFDIVLDADDPLNSALPATDNPLWMKLDFAAAASGNVIALIERLGPLD
jgi:hypothetical protein